MRAGRLVGAIALTCCAVAPPLARPQAAMYALVVGIDDYRNIRKLNGAVNDSRDIAAALRTAGAKDIILLNDAAAKRDAVFAAWDKLIGESGPDDTLVFSFAGHGTQAPERIKGAEADGKDEMLVLAGFAEKGEGTAQRIIDDEIGEMFDRAKPRKVVFVSDSCHSGTMTRGLDRRVGGKLGTRYVPLGPIEDDDLPPPAPTKSAPTDETGGANVIYLGAVADNEEAPEVLIDGTPRGALSWAFARALRGNADADADGGLSKSELEAFVMSAVRMRVEGRQHPQILPAGRGVDVILRAAADETPRRVFSGFSSVEPLSVKALGDGAAAIVEAAGGARVATDGAALIWDATTGDVVSAQGDVVATVPKTADAVEVARSLRRVIDKWSVLARVETAAARHSLTFEVKPNDRLHKDGEKLTVVVGGFHHPYYTLVSLSADGTVNYLYPINDAKFRDSERIPVDKPFLLELRAEAPFGADHFIAIASAEPLTDLNRDLAALDGTPSAAKVIEALERRLPGKTVEMGRHGIYTAAR